MKKSFLRWLLVGGIIIAALAIVFVGFFGYRSRMNQAKIDFAINSAAQSTGQIERLTTTTNGFFQDNTQVFLTSEASVENINQALNELKGIQTSAADYGITDEELPNDFGELAAEKVQLISLAQTALDKATVQAQINALFVAPVSNWQNYTDDVVIRDNLTESDIETAQATLAPHIDSAWKISATAYLQAASDQLALVRTIQAEFLEFIPNDELADDATSSDYYALSESVASVKNETLRTSFETQLSTFQSLLGLSSSSTYN